LLKENKEQNHLKITSIYLILIVVHVGLFAPEKEDVCVENLVKQLEEKLPASTFHPGLANIPSLIFNVTKKTEEKLLKNETKSTKEKVVQEYLKVRELPIFPRAILKIRELHRKLNFYSPPPRTYYFPSRTNGDGDNILWHPKEDAILSCRGGMTHVWDISKMPGQKYVKTFIDASGNFTVQTLSHNGHYLATGGESNVPVRIWDLKQNKAEGAVKTLEHCDDISSIDFSSDDKQLAIAQSSPAIHIWSWTHEQPENPAIKILTAAGKKIIVLRFIDQSWLISGSKDGTIHKWRINVNKPISECKLNNRITSLYVKNNDTTLVCSTTNQIYILHLLTLDGLQKLSLDNSQYAQMRFNHRTNQIGVYEKTRALKSPVHIWKKGNIKDSDPVEIESNNPDSKILDCTFSPNGSHIALLTTEDEIEICEIPQDYSSITAYTFDKLFELVAKNIEEPDIKEESEQENQTQKIEDLKIFCLNTCNDLDDDHKKRVLHRLQSQSETWDIAEELKKQKSTQADPDLEDFKII